MGGGRGREVTGKGGESVGKGRGTLNLSTPTDRMGTIHVSRKRLIEQSRDLKKIPEVYGNEQEVQR